MSNENSDAGDGWFFAIPGGLALLLVIGAAILIALGRHEAAVTSAMRSWPSTMGTVASAGLRDERQQDGSWIQFADTTVRYEVNGRSHEITFGVYAGRGTWGHEKSLRYRANDPVRVFYNPADPSQASLTNDRETPDYLGVLIGAGCLALSLPFWYLAFRMFIKQRRSSAGALNP